MRKKLCAILAGVLCAGMLLTGCSGGSDVTVSVQSVGMITGIGSVGMYDRYAGIVESGDTIDIQKDESMEVQEILVKAGDTVTAGQLLFTYNTEVISLELEKKQLELDQLKNSITTKNNQIAALEKEKASAPAAEQLDYTLQIQALQVEVKEAEYNITAKEKELERSKATLENAEVKSEVDGTVKSINTDNATDDFGNLKPFISITQAGDYRVKGTLNEQNRSSVYEGMPVIIRSRTEDVTWTGTVSLVDLEHPMQDNSNIYYGPVDEMSSSSNYPFYIALDSDADLMLGQHVYIEPNLGQDAQTSFYLPAYYIVDADEGAYVWAADKDDELEKRQVELGTFDEGLNSYEILGGLSAEDYIAMPDESCAAGVSVSYYDENSFGDGSVDGGVDGDMGVMPDDGMDVAPDDDMGVAPDTGMDVMPGGLARSDDTAGTEDAG